MKISYRNSLVFNAIVSILFLVSCEKEQVTNQDSTFKSPGIASKENILKIPETVNSTTAGTTIGDFVSMVNGLTVYTNMLSKLPDNAVESETKSTSTRYSWTDPVYGTVWIVYSEDDLNYNWDYYYQTPQMTSIKLAIKVTELKSGQDGAVFIFGFEDLSLPIFTYTWNQSATGISAILVMAYGDSSFYATFANNTDGSGTLNVYKALSAIADMKYMDVSWDKSSHGSYWVKDGSVISGSF